MDLIVDDASTRASGGGSLAADLLAEMEQVVVGQRAMLERLLIGLLANGHILIEGVPGIAKTLAATTLAKALSASYQRIQFTPDLLPADLVGTLIYHPASAEFRVRKGPVFANLLLADEINRAPAKVQSALLEAMQENQVTIGETTYPLPTPFLVLATQNPVEHDGTYPLPEAQLDRFMLKIRVGYPSAAEELLILDRMARTDAVPEVSPVASPEQILAERQEVDAVYIDDKVKRYIVELVSTTREPGKHGLDLDRFVEYGASPRASIYLALAAKAHAHLRGRSWVTPQDVKSIAPDVLRHRVITTFEADADGVGPEDLIRRILDHVPVP
jgi:MoxR-like ATPase